MKKDGLLGKSLAGVAAVSVMVVSLAGNVYAGDCPTGSLRDSYTNSISECNIAENHAGSNNLMGTINTILSVILGILGVVAVAYIIYGGFMITTASGDPAKVKKGKETIMYGVIGLVVALLAFAIVNFVLSSVFSGAASGGE